jgi:hypothetical protein
MNKRAADGLLKICPRNMDVIKEIHQFRVQNGVICAQSLVLKTISAVLRIRIHGIRMVWGILDLDQLARCTDPDPLIRGTYPVPDQTIIKQK